jgi:6-phosphofructokinase 2
MSVITMTMNPSVDVTTVTDRLLPDRKLRCGNPLYEPGGGGINVSRAIKKLGGESLACFPAGGSNGDLLEKLLEKEAIETLVLRIAGMTRQNITVREKADEQQYRFVMPGPRVTDPEWQSCLRAIDELDPIPRYLVASGSLPPGAPTDLYSRLADIAEKRNTRLVVDTSGAALRSVIDKPVFLIKPNVREITDLMTIDTEDETEIEQAARRMLLECGCRYLIVSLGSGGALLISKQTSRHFRSPTVPIKSKVGAGDSMVAGIVLSLTRTDDIVQATKFGVAAGASAVMTPGSELCRRDTTEELVKKI